MMSVAVFFIIVGLGLNITTLITGAQIYTEISMFILAVVVAVFWIGERISVSVAESENWYIMKMLCIIGLIVIFSIIFVAALPSMFAVISRRDDDFETEYTLGLISSMIIIISIISIIIVNFYFAPESFGYQKIVSENCIESEE